MSFMSGVWVAVGSEERSSSSSFVVGIIGSGRGMGMGVGIGGSMCSVE
jgi:hypothetical protein